MKFENLSSATAAAQVVTITLTLDADLDAATFRIADYGFGSTYQTVPGGGSTLSTRLTVNPTLLVDVDAVMNPATGQLVWTFRSVDAGTGEPPEDVFGGFLPPNAISPQGEGFVSFIVRAKQPVANATRFDAQAAIVFDTNAPINTPAISTLIDTAAPTSSVNALPATSPAAFPVSWTGSDDGGSGIASYEVYVSVDGGPFTVWLSGTTATSGTYAGAAGHSYGFFSLATDYLGNRQTTPAGAQATTSVALPTATPTATPPPGATPTATIVPPTVTPESRTIHLPAGMKGYTGGW